MSCVCCQVAERERERGGGEGGGDGNWPVLHVCVSPTFHIPLIQIFPSSFNRSFFVTFPVLHAKMEIRFHYLPLK